MPKVYDCFIFFNELDLLELRLETLDPYVDYFVISECDSTFSGLDKPFFYEKYKEKFAKFNDKIIHVKNYNSKDYTILNNTHEGKKREIYDIVLAIHDDHKTEHGHGQPHWCRDYLHREYMKLGMSDCAADDIIIFSDADEIPSPEFLKTIRDLDMSKQYCLLQDNNNYYVNNIASTNWRGNIVCNYSYLKNRSLNMLRYTSRNEKNSDFVFVNNGGWHLSFIGGPERIKQKLKSYSHQEFNNDVILNHVEHNMHQNKDIFFRNSNTYTSELEEFYFDSMKVMDLDSYLPQVMVGLIKEKFPYLEKK